MAYVGAIESQPRARGPVPPALGDPLTAAPPLRLLSDRPDGDSLDRPRRRVLVVDASDLVRLGMRLLLAEQPWVERCLGARDRAEAEELTARFEPHVALIELFLPDDFGVEIARALHAAHPRLRILLMASSAKISVEAARRAGACGFVVKSSPAKQIVCSIRAADRGRLAFGRPPEPPRAAPHFSTRELQILTLIAAGATNREIGAALYLSPNTVKQHTTRIYRKLGVRNRAEAVRLAQRVGLIS